MKRLFTLLLMVTLSALPTLAQDATLIPADQANDTARVMSLIEDVEMTQQDNQPVALIFGTLPDGCDRPTLISKERQGPVLFIDVYHDPVAPSVVTCPTKLIPFAVNVMVEEMLMLDENQTLPTTLAVNDHYFSINIAQIESVGTPPALPPITLTPLIRSEVTVDSLSLNTPAEGSVTIKGVLSSGCADTPLTRFISISDPSQTPRDYGIDIFQLVEDPARCPDTYVAVKFELAVKIPVDQQQGDTIKILDKTAEITAPGITPTQGASMMKVPHTIKSVDALILESLPAHIKLAVKGYQPDGCDAPVHIAQSRQENSVKVEIYRELPADSICPMVAKEFQTDIDLDGSFASGTYTIDVNGKVITVKI